MTCQFVPVPPIDSQYHLDYFPANIKQKIVSLPKSEVKNCIFYETGRSVQVPLVPPNKSKTNQLKIMLTETFCCSILHLNQKKLQAPIV